MKKYLLKRFVYIIVVFFIISFMMYAIYNLIPSDPALVIMEPLRKKLKPNIWQAQYEAMKEEMGLNDNIVLRYARWMGIAPRRVDQYHFVEAETIKSGKRYLITYDGDETPYMLGNVFAGTGDYAEKFPAMGVTTVVKDENEPEHLTIVAKDTREFIGNMKGFLFTAKGSDKKGWTFRNTAHGYLIFDNEGLPTLTKEIDADSFERWTFDENHNLINKNWTGENKYIGMAQREEGKTNYDYLAPMSAPDRHFRFFEIKDLKISGMLQGNFGQSLNFKRPVTEVIGVPMLNSIILNLVAEIFALAVTIPLGIYCAVHARKPMDTTIQAVTIVGYSIPSFIIAILFIYVFAVVFRIFPPGGAKPPGSTATGIKEFGERMYYMALPIITILFMSLAGGTRMIRAAMLDSLSEDYVRTARAKGLREKVVIYSHAWRNALLPVSTSIIGGFIAIFTGGALIIENAFALNGLGRLYFIALTTSDFELVLALQMFYNLIGLVGVLITDISYTLIDPRVRIEK